MLLGNNVKKVLKIFRKAPRFFEIPLCEKLLFLFALALCGIFRFALLFVPFRFLSRFLTRSGGTRRNVDTATERKKCMLVSRLVNVAAGMTPWESKCLVRALAAKMLLRIYGYPNELYLGVKKTETGNLVAHAWINSCGYNICGGNDIANAGYAVVGKYFDE